MINFLFMTDPHVSGTRPSTRTDDFPETILRKIENFFEVGAHGVPLVVGRCDRGKRRNLERASVSKVR